jgi:hypothetical protein
MSAFVFLGPSLSTEEARDVLPGVDVLPPVALGDVYRAALRRPVVIGIVDGYFEQRPAVFHKEILWALDQGISVVGSSSMGALRAAELSAFGMEGVGEIFRCFAAGTLTADDEVAVSHASETHGFRPMSEPLVNIRATLTRARQDGIVSAGTAAMVVAVAKGSYYPDRIWPTMLDAAVESGAPGDEVARLLSWLPGNAVDQKRLDALELLRRMREIVTDGGARPVDFDFSNTTFWMDARRAVDTAADVSAPWDSTVDAVLEELRLHPSDYELTVERARARYVAVTLAEHYALRPEVGTVLEESLRFRRGLGLEAPSAVADWQQANDLGDDELLRLLTQESRIRWISATADAAQRSYLVDYLRVTGRYGDLARRCRDKREALRAAGLEFPTLATAQLHHDEVIAWFQDRQRAQARPGTGAHLHDGAVTDASTSPPDLQSLAEEVGFRDGPELLRALLREYLYSRVRAPGALVGRLAVN